MPTATLKKPRLSRSSKKIDKKIDIGFTRTCACADNHLNCLTPKEWMKSQLGVWEFFYEKRDIRKKDLHPATFPLALAKKAIELFTHQGELVVDPFNGSGTTLLAANDLGRNAVGFDIGFPAVLEQKRTLSRPVCWTPHSGIFPRLWRK